MPAGAPPGAARVFTSDTGCVTATQAVSRSRQTSKPCDPNQRPFELGSLQHFYNNVLDSFGIVSSLPQEFPGFLSKRKRSGIVHSLVVPLGAQDQK